MNGGAWVRPGPGTIDLFVAAARARWGWRPSVPPADGPVWLDGSVRLVADEDCGCGGRREGSVGLTDTTHPILQHADRVLQLWPEAREEAKALLDEILSWGPKPGTPMNLAATGGSCGPWRGWGSIMVTAGNPVGYAEGVLHELGHHKLRAVGIDMEQHNARILLNPPTELYDSGVRKDRKRPMSAVLHAHYSYLHVTEIELRAHSAGYDARAMLPLQLRRLTEGRTEIARHARWTAEGAAARETILEWSDDLIRRCEAIVSRET